MSMCVRYAGDSYTYLLDSVATDHARTTGSPMTRYYTVAGTPPGSWLGTGLTGLADGQGLPKGSVVTPAQMARLFADGLDPATGAALGRSPHVYSNGSDRRRPVAGFDLTFTVPKSVSVLWGLADEPTRDAIYACHRDAIADVLALVERDVARTRTGTNGVAQVETRGVIAAAFDHWDSRDNDPNLHTHVVIANRVQGPDGRWRTLDSRAIHRATVAISELYDGLLADRVTARLGLAWEYRERGPRRNPAYELTTVPPGLIAEFSQRSRRIDIETNRLIAGYVADHGRRPDPAIVLRLRQQATLATRPTKEVHPLQDLSADWRERAGRIVGGDATGWARDTISWAALAVLPGPASSERAAESDNRSARMVEEAATAVLASLTRKRSTWTLWNVQAEASRALRAHRFPTAQERDTATTLVAAQVSDRSVLLTPPETTSTPTALRRADGSSTFRATNSSRYTSHELLAAEARLLHAGRDTGGPRVADGPDIALGGLHDDQSAAVRAITGSGRMLDVLVGPAGSGKTRTLAELRTVWEAQHGPSMVVGLAPSAAAAEALAASLGIATENTAKWLTEHDLQPDRQRRANRLRAAIAAAPDPATARTLAAARRDTTAELEQWRFRPGQLVLVDEASLAGTLDLDRIATTAREAGAKLLLVGDWAQLSSIEAGGAFGLLVRDRSTTAPELGSARRFTHEWERAASTALRVGDPSAVDSYIEHDRVTAGDHPAVIDAAWRAWSHDEHAGLRSLMIAADRGTVRDLNERARAERIATGHVHADGAPLNDGLTAGIGDRIVTRRNDRHLAVGAGWVKNGDTWTVTAHTPDGGLAVQRPTGGPTVVLPADYVAEHVELGYATTAHRAQGSTVDTAHAVVAGGVSREVLYVMLTRARHANHVYVATDRDTEPLTGFTDDAPTARGILLAALANPGTAVSAHEMSQDEHETNTSIPTLAAEYETLATRAQAPRWAAALANARLTPAQIAEIGASPAYGALATALRRADASGLLVEAALPGLARRLVDGAHDPAAVLHSRVERWGDAARERGHGGRIATVAGLLPAVLGEVPDGFRFALDQRAELMNRRIDILIARAKHADAPWLHELGPQPLVHEQAASWETARRAIAAYRDRYSITSASALGPESAEQQQKAARRHCVQLLQSATQPADPHATRPLHRRLPAPVVQVQCQTPRGR